MVGRLTLLGVLLATLPLAVDVPGSRDSSSASGLQVQVAGGLGQFAVISRGCEGEVLSETDNQLRSGELEVQQRFASNIIVGVRAGSVHTTLNTKTTLSGGPPNYTYRDTVLTDSYSNPFVNPYFGLEGRHAGFGVGWIKTDRPLAFGGGSFHAPGTTWHVRFGDEASPLTLRWMEDVPLESEGHLSVDLGIHLSSKYEMGVFAGLVGPYDGTMVGLRGRLWLTPEAAAQIKASVGAHSEYGIYGSVTARLPGQR